MGSRHGIQSCPLSVWVSLGFLPPSKESLLWLEAGCKSGKLQEDLLPWRGRSENFSDSETPPAPTSGPADPTHSPNFPGHFSSFPAEVANGGA